MAYQIYKTDGTLLATIADGQIDTSTLLQLPGPNYVGYGQRLDENLVHLLENFASNSAPIANNIQGQLWFNQGTQSLNVFTTEGYVPVSGITVSGTRPSSVNVGATWFSETTNQYYLFDGTNWNLIGPVYNKSQGPSGALPLTVNDGSISGVTHNIVTLQYGNLVIATLSSDSEFVPRLPSGAPMSGFAKIRPGITFNSDLVGTTTNTNVTGNLTGNVTGNLTGNVVTALNVYGNLHGNVTATSISGNLTASTITGNLSGNVRSVVSYADNFSSGNVLITGGSITVNSVISNNLQVGSFVTSNITVTTGNITGISQLSAAIGSVTNLTATNSSATNFVTSNAQITSGNVTGITNLTATNSSATNFVTSNAQITSGNVTGITNLTATNLGAVNFITSNAQITGGNISGITNLTATNLGAVNFITSNAQITGGDASNITGNLNIFGQATLVDSVALTSPAYNSNSTALATTEFVQSVLPRGVIVMWGGSVVSIPTGWQLCDGSNGSPDLRNQFVIGAGSSYAPGSTGGTTSVSLSVNNLPAHMHTFSGNTSISGNTSPGSANLVDPGHSHSVAAGGSGINRVSLSGSQNNSYATSTATTGITDSGHAHVFSAIGSFSGNTGTTGTGAAFSIVPPFYALCYIQKMF